ncbi:MAG: hypothetical protein WCL61_02315 [bacterium]
MSEQTTVDVPLGESLTSPLRILQQTWQTYKKHWLLYASILLLPNVLMWPLNFVGDYIGQSESLVVYFWSLVVAGDLISNWLIGGIIIYLILLAIVILVVFWAQISLIVVINQVDKVTDWKQAFLISKAKIWSFAGTSVLQTLIVVGGLLLLVVPGFIWGIWYAFVPYVVICEGLVNMPALRQSKKYVAGRFWAVVWRLVFIAVVGMVLGLIFNLLQRSIMEIVILITQALGSSSVMVLSDINLVIISMMNLVLALLVAPIAVIYNYLVYKNLKETAK